MTQHDPFLAHVEAELGINPNELTNPLHAAIASALAFVTGASIPLAAILIPPESSRIPITFMSVIFALTVTGYLSARAGKAKARKAILRVIMGGVIAMTITYFIGKLFGISV